MSNTEELTYWNGDSGERWALFQERIDAAFAPLTARALTFADPRPGEAALDVGCGCGDSTLAIARRTQGARTVGIDFSRPMLDVAERRARAHGLDAITWVAGDAATYAFDAPHFDLAFSRFGVMFFDDPAAAFANVRRALAPGARLVFVCWRALDQNPWFHVPLGVVRPLVAAPPKVDPDAPGPMSLADPERVRGILGEAGFREISLLAFDAALPFGGRTAAAAFLMQIGPTHRLLSGADEAVQAEARTRIEDALRDRERAGVVELGAGVWLVRALA